MADIKSLARAAAALLLLALALSLGGAAAQSPTAPTDLALALRLKEHSDNVIGRGENGAGEEGEIEAELTFKGDPARLDIADGAYLRLLGVITNWEASSLSNPARLPIPAQSLSAPAPQLPTPSGLIAGDQFGRAVASDGQRIVAVSNNKAFVFHDDDGWKLQHTLTLPAAAPDPEPTDPYCHTSGDDLSIAIQGDIVVVGAPKAEIKFPRIEDDTSTPTDESRDEKIVGDAGCVYLFALTAGADANAEPAGRLLATLMPAFADADGASGTSAANGVNFGAAVDIAGNLIVVGAPLAPNNSNNTGRVYVFSKPADTPGANPGDDPTPNPWTDDDTTATDGPAVLSWSAAATNGPADGVDEACLGASVAISADGGIIAAGAPNADQDVVNGSSGTPPEPTTAHTADIGAVFVFVKPSGAWTTSAAPLRLDIDPNPEDDASIEAVRNVARALSISDDGTVIAASGADSRGAYDHDNNPATDPVDTWAGAAFVWVKPPDTPAINPGDSDMPVLWAAAEYETARLTVSDSAAEDRVGAAVAVKSDGSQILISHTEDPGSSETTDDDYIGGVYVFIKPEHGWDNSETDLSAAATLASADHGKFLPPQQEQDSGEEDDDTRANGFYGAALAWFEPPAPAQGAARPAAKVVVGQPQDSDTRTVAADDKGKGKLWLAYDLAGTAGVWTLCSAAVSGSTTTYTCPISFNDDTTLHTRNTQDGERFTVSANNLSVNGASVEKSYEILIGELVQLHTVRLTRASGPSRPELGSTVQLKLAITNERSHAANPTALNSVVVTATGGSLSSPVGIANSCSGTVCQLNTALMHSTGSVNLTNNLPITWVAPASTGNRTISVDVRGPEHDQAKTASISFTVIGSADSITIGPAPSIYYRPTANDNRDLVEFEVTAQDEDGRSTRVPSELRRWDVKATGSSPDSVKNQFTLTRDPSSGTRNGKVHLRLTVTGRSLSPAQYELSAQLGQARATRIFRVVGDPTAIRIRTQGSRLTGQRITYILTASDVNGAWVADGTPVTFERIDVGSQVLADAGSLQTVISGGRAETQFVVIATGRATVRGCAASACELAFFSVGGVIGGGGSGGGSGGGGSAGGGGGSGGGGSAGGGGGSGGGGSAGGGGGSGGGGAPPPPPPPPVAELLSQRVLDTPITWTGERTIRAADILDAITEAAAAMLWNGKQWLPYGRIGDQLIPGSINFFAATDAPLWLTGPPTPPTTEDEDSP